MAQAVADEGPFVALEAVDAQAPMRCFRRSPELSYRESIRALCSIGRAPENRPDIKQIPDAEDGDLLIKFVEKEVVLLKDNPVVADLIRRCGLTDTDLCALMSIKLENPFPLYRWLNAWLQGQRRDNLVGDKVGPFFKLMYRAMEKLPKVRVPAARAVIVNDIPALQRTFDNHKERLKPGKELSFWSPASFSTQDDVVNREEFVGSVHEAAIVYACGELEGVDMEPFKPRGLRAEYEVMPLCPAVFRVVTSVKIGAKLVVSLAQDLQEHAEQAYVAPTVGAVTAPGAAVPNAAAPQHNPNTPQQQQNSLLSPRSVALSAELLDWQRYPYTAAFSTTHIRTGELYRDAALSLITKYNNSVGWWALGQSMSATEMVSVRGRQVSQRDCYFEAVTQDPKNSMAWDYFAFVLTPTERVPVNGRQMSQRECYLEAVTLDPRHPYAWNDLGTTMSETERVTVNGRSLGKQDCYVEAVTHSAKNPLAWFNLGVTVSPTELVAVNGRQLSKRDCYVEALTHDPTYANAWNNLGASIAAVERVTVNGRQMNKLDCYVEALAHNPMQANAWSNLGASMNAAEHVTVNGRQMSQRECYLKALTHEPSLSSAWSNLALSMSAGERVTVNGRDMSQSDCHLKANAVPGVALQDSNAPHLQNALLLSPRSAALAAELLDVKRYPFFSNFATVHVSTGATYRDAALALVERYNNSVGWWALGQTMKAMERVAVNGRQMSQWDCYFEAVTQDPKNSMAWDFLAFELTATERVPVNGRQMSRRDCYVEALTLDPKHPYAWNDLALSMGETERLTLNGRTYSQRDCYIEAAVHFPTYSFAWNNLANALSATETAVVGGRRMNQLDCYLEALKHNPKDSKAWHNLGVALSATECVVVNGREVSQRDCLLTALVHEPRYSTAWRNLGATMTPAESVRVQGRPMSKRGCYLEALSIDPKDRFAWSGLGNSLSANEQVVVNGESVTMEQCIQRAR